MKQTSTMQGRHNASPSNQNIPSQNNRQQNNDYNLPSIGSDRLLTINDVSRITGLCAPVASELIKETGRAITIHRRVYILESSFLAFLKEQEQRTSRFTEGR